MLHWLSECRCTPVALISGFSFPASGGLQLALACLVTLHLKQPSENVKDVTFFFTCKQNGSCYASFQDQRTSDESYLPKCKPHILSPLPSIDLWLQPLTLLWNFYFINFKFLSWLVTDMFQWLWTWAIWRRLSSNTVYPLLANVDDKLDLIRVCVLVEGFEDNTVLDIDICPLVSSCLYTCANTACIVFFSY